MRVVRGAAVYKDGCRPGQTEADTQTTVTSTYCHTNPPLYQPTISLTLHLTNPTSYQTTVTPTHRLTNPLSHQPTVTPTTAGRLRQVYYTRNGKIIRSALFIFVHKSNLLLLAVDVDGGEQFAGLNCVLHWKLAGWGGPGSLADIVQNISGISG